MTVHLRGATVDDLPKIHGLVRESFSAMTAQTGPRFEPMWAKEAENAIARGDISARAFSDAYLSGPDALGFWVAARDDLGVIGCVGLKRASAGEAELVRMSVSASARSDGIGAQLVAELVAFARRRGITRIHLRTANAAAARFYAKVGFGVVHELQHTFTQPETLTLTVFEMALELVTSSRAACV